MRFAAKPIRSVVLLEMMKSRHQICPSRGQLRAPKNSTGAFTRTDLLITLATLSAVAILVLVPLGKMRERQKLRLCSANLGQVGRALTLYATDHGETLPGPNSSPQGDLWWNYKELVKQYVGLAGPSSPNDRIFSCPDDRGYSDKKPFCQSARFDFGSYVFNGVILPGVPNIAGRKIPTVVQPNRTLLVMEWSAHGPLSWHRSKTGKANAPFYCDAENVVAFVDGHVHLSKIYYDGYDAAYTRDPIAGYDYKFSGD